MRESDLCPRCQNREDGTHVLTCPAPAAATAWTEALKKVDTFLEHTDTHPILRTTIIANLNGIRAGGPGPHLSSNRNIRAVVLEQCPIGWPNMIFGFVHTKWKRLYEQTRMPQSKSRYTGERWITALIKRLFEVSWDMWTHRNGVLHATQKSVNPAEAERLRLRIDEEFLTGPLELPEQDHHRFRNKQALLQSTLDHQRRWLQDIALCRRKAKSALELDPTTSNLRESIYDWLQRPSTQAWEAIAQRSERRRTENEQLLASHGPTLVQRSLGFPVRQRSNSAPPRQGQTTTR